MAQPAKRFFTPAEYLAMEEVAETKHEYFNGEIFDMVGASRNHVRIATNMIRALGNALEAKPCEVYTSDMRLLVKPTGLYTYPDVTVVGGKPEFLKGRTATLLNPTLIVEILSESTRDYDREQKFELYKALTALKEYVLIEQARPHVECFQRVARSRKWLVEMVDGLDKFLQLKSVACEIVLRRIYNKVEFESET